MARPGSVQERRGLPRRSLRKRTNGRSRKSSTCSRVLLAQPWLRTHDLQDFQPPRPHSGLQRVDIQPRSATAQPGSHSPHQHVHLLAHSQLQRSNGRGGSSTHLYRTTSAVRHHRYSEPNHDDATTTSRQDNAATTRNHPVTGPTPATEELWVIYDEGCEFCRRCRSWLEGQAQVVQLNFLPATDPQVQAWGQGWCPVGDELVVTNASGAVWIGPAAFSICLWALRDHQALAMRLQHPGMSHLAKQAFHALSLGRGTISQVLSATSPTRHQSPATAPSPPTTNARETASDCGPSGCDPHTITTDSMP